MPLFDFSARLSTEKLEVITMNDDSINFLGIYLSEIWVHVQSMITRKVSLEILKTQDFDVV